MKTLEKNSQENVKTASDNKSTNSELVASSTTPSLIKQRKKMIRRKRIIHSKITKFDRNSVVNFVNDMQGAINQICTNYGTKNVEVEMVKFMENDLEINGLHVRLPEPTPIKTEMSIIDATSHAIQNVKRNVKDAVKTVGEYVGKEFKQGYRTFKILGQSGDKYEAVTRRHKIYMLSGEEIDKMKLIS